HLHPPLPFITGVTLGAASPVYSGLFTGLASFLRPQRVSRDRTTDTTEHWIEVLEAAGVLCATIYDYQQMFADPQVRHRSLAHTPPTANWVRSRTSVPGQGRRQHPCAYGRSPSSASTTPRSFAEWD